MFDFILHCSTSIEYSEDISEKSRLRTVAIFKKNPDSSRGFLLSKKAYCGSEPTTKAFETAVPQALVARTTTIWLVVEAKVNTPEGVILIV